MTVCTDVVLYSGGIESTYCMLMSPPHAVALFVDYGQPYANREREVVVESASRTLHLHTVQWFNEKELQARKWPYRNELLMSTAVTLFKPERVWFGCRAPHYLFDRYNDANATFARALGKSLGIEVVMPCLMLPTFVLRRRIEAMAPGIKVYSSKGHHDYLHKAADVFRRASGDGT